MRSIHAFGIAASMALVIAPLACSKTSGDGTSNTTQSVAQAPPSTPIARPSGRRADRGPGAVHGGMTGMMLHAASELELKDPQKETINKLGERLKGDDPMAQAEFKDYQAALVAGIKAGKVETAKLAPLQAAAEKAMQARKDKEAETLNALYAALEPPQRKALVAEMRSRQAEHDARTAAHTDNPPKPPEAEATKRRMEHLTKELDLDAAQQKSVEVVVAKQPPMGPESMETMREEMKKHTDAILTAFEGDGFDAKKLEATPMDKKMGEMMDKHVQFLSQLLPILKPEQREKLAGRIERPMRPRMGPGQPGMGVLYSDPLFGEASSP